MEDMVDAKQFTPTLKEDLMGHSQEVIQELDM